MPLEEAEPVFRMAGRAVGIPGYINGLTQPCLRFELTESAAIDPHALAEADRWMSDTFASIAGMERFRPAGGDARITHFLAWTRMILVHRGHPVFGPPRVRRASAGWIVQQPCLDFGACFAAAELAIEAINLAASHQTTALTDALDAVLAARSDALERGRPGGFNTLHFIEAAHALELPWQRLVGNIIQIGHGARSRLLDSSMTDRTGAIGTALVRNKTSAAELMRAAGLPVPAHVLVASENEAVAAASRLGYPVVVKPADQDGGVGVAAFLHDADTVRAAYGRAAAHSQRVLVESYVSGNDYRVQVVDGVVHGVLERSPGGVVGDGTHSVAALVDRQNRERDTATDDRRHLHAIAIDEEAERLLAAAGLSWATVPKPGFFVRLRGASNVAGGGIPRQLAVEDAHPDNLALAVRAAQVLRLDVAGVDMLMPDIRRSWLETGAGICEVNAKPQMFTTFHQPMLRSMMDGGLGRIPLVAVLCTDPQEQLSGMLHAHLCHTMPNAGLVRAGSAQVGARRIVAGDLGSFDGARALLIDPTVECLVLAVSDRQVFARGWPFDRCDAVVLAKGGDAAPDAAAKARFAQLCGMAKVLRPRAVFVASDDPSCRAVGQEPGWIGVEAIAGGDEAVALAAAEWLVRS